MAAKNVVGTIRQVKIDDVTYNVPMDVNVTHIFTKYENDSVPTSGKSMRKMTRVSPNIEGLVVIVNADEQSTLKSVNDALDLVALSVTTAAGDTYRSPGWVNVENRESEEGRATLKLMPEDDWAEFISEVS